MSNSSPSSIRSQALISTQWHDDLPPACSITPEINSQAPLNTQLPYIRSLEENVDPSSSIESLGKDDTVRRLPNDSPDSPVREALDHGGQPRHAAREGQPQQPNSEGSASPQPAGCASVEVEEQRDDDQPTSSNPSLECQPCNAPLTKPTPEDVDNKVQFLHHKENSQRPFPLVEWIREIRKETPKYWAAQPLRWTSSHSKKLQKQRAILETDDACKPPLAGRPARAGTIPVTILDVVTARIDRNAQAKLQQTEIEIDGGSNSLALPPNIPAQKLTEPAEGSQATAQGSDDEPPQWSSSPPEPPRRQVPVDTSPVRDVSRPHNPTSHLESIEEAGNDETETAGSLIANYPQAKPLVLSQLRGIPTVTEHEPGVCESGSVKSLPGLQQRSPFTHSTAPPTTGLHGEADSDPPAKFIVSPSKVDAKVLVQDTPYANKDNTTVKVVAEDHDEPPSSFVAATYPERRFARSRKTGEIHCLEAPIQRDRVPQNDPPSLDGDRESFTARMNTPTLSVSTNRSYDASGNLKRPAVTEIAKKTATPNGLVAGHSLLSHEPLLPSSKRPRIDPDLQALDERRLLEKRKFRRSISTSWQNAGPENPTAYVQKHFSKNVEMVSMPSSPPELCGQSDLSEIEVPDTPATNVSVLRKPASHVKSRNDLSRYKTVEESLTSAFSRFVAAYPDYRGSLKSFGSAVRLLVKLKSLPHEPHPSLWDDFVYRMTGDYKPYLQQCIEDDESALSYQEYYYVHVRRAERSKEVITEDVLQGLLLDTRQQPVDFSKSGLWQSRSASSVLGSEHARVSVVKDMVADMHDTSRAHRGSPAINGLHGDVDVTMTNVEEAHTASKAKVSTAPDSRTSVTQAAITSTATPAPTFQTPLLPASERGKPYFQITTPIISSDSKKRRSLPWNTESTHQSKLSSRQQLPDVRKVPSSAKSSTSSDVEGRLNSTPSLIRRMSGMASPELEPITLPAHRESSRGVTRDHEVSSPRRPQKSMVAQSIESPLVLSPGPAGVMHQPESRFSLFASNYAKLQSEHAVRASPANKQRLPINIYNCIKKAALSPSASLLLPTKTTQFLSTVTSYQISNQSIDQPPSTNATTATPRPPNHNLNTYFTSMSSKGKTKSSSSSSSSTSFKNTSPKRTNSPKNWATGQGFQQYPAGTGGASWSSYGGKAYSSSKGRSEAYYASVRPKGSYERLR